MLNKLSKIVLAALTSTMLVIGATATASAAPSVPDSHGRGFDISCSQDCQGQDAN